MHCSLYTYILYTKLNPIIQLVLIERPNNLTSRLLFNPPLFHTFR